MEKIQPSPENGQEQDPFSMLLDFVEVLAKRLLELESKVGDTSPHPEDAAFMDEIRTLIKGKEDEEKKTQQLVEKHNSDIADLKKEIENALNE